MQNPQNFGNFARVYATSQVLCQSTNTFAIKGIIWELYATENVIGKLPNFIQPNPNCFVFKFLTYQQPHNIMHIANPIYDVVFKYLMDDNKIAKLIISSIISEEIEELIFKPLEFIGNFEQKTSKRTSKAINKQIIPGSLTVYRLDFSAKIKTAEGYKQVLIEIQKAKFPTDIMRFRRYLGDQYSNKENMQKVPMRTEGRTRKVGLPIISIYFLGHKLDRITASAIGINRHYRNLITNEPITEKEIFIESLTHDSYIIQIPYLTTKRRNDLEILLSVFDQSNAIDADYHILNVKEEDFPEKYRSIIRKLQKAAEDTEVKQKMSMEDDILDELAELERLIADLEGEKEQERKEKEQERKEKEQERKEKEQERKEKEQERKEKEQERKEKEQAMLQLSSVEQEKEQAMLQNQALLDELAALRKLLEKK